ncbi:hypothetical protein [Mangrovibacterium diazotrophicum]|uniref:Uncharacterized protein n=1 Tax=Mangrovibacterium diazotrophicum TaxID=1261403 RepID=A0A419W434_9BACT|nr:hypothetical protein [Mangrovibacterium diazotrophicum]RKD90205.1 hypothetical protein BC643_0541 [Mangrovibacterium diazotrophicum]
MFKQEQPGVPISYVLFRKILSFLNAGRMLHLFCLISLFLTSVFLKRLLQAEHWYWSWHILPTLLFATLVVTTQLDAYSRYQNYKQVKDLLYLHGFRALLLGPFSHSRCQRDAVWEAAKQLSYAEQTQKYFKKLGYRWYHILPTPILKKPGLLLTKGYWATTFFVHYYPSKYFHW